MTTQELGVVLKDMDNKAPYGYSIASIITTNQLKNNVIFNKLLLFKILEDENG